MIYRIEQFIDDDGRQVILKRQIEDDKHEYFGTFQAPHPMGMGAIPVQFDFPDDEIENTKENTKESFKETLSKCFEEFDKLAKKEYERMIEEFRDEQLKKQILTPEDTGGIIIP